MASIRETLGSVVRAGVSRAARAMGLGPSAAAATPTARAGVPREPRGDTVLREPSSRMWIDWDADRIQAAEIQASQGGMRLAGELCHALLADERVISTLGVLTRGLVGLPLSFEAGVGRRKSGAVKALDAEEDWYAMIDEAALAELLRWGVLLGVGLARLVPFTGPSGRLLLRLEVWDPRWLRFDSLSQRWMVTTANAGEIPVDEDGRWILFTPFGEHRPWERGLYRGVSRWVLLKKYAREDWGRHSEVKAQGVLVAFSPTSATGAANDISPTQRKRLGLDLQHLGRDAALVLPKGLDLKLIESTAKNYETFQAQIEISNTGITIAFLGQNLSTEVKGGSFAAAQVHQQVADYLRRAYAASLAAALHDKLLVWWALWNFGDARTAPWPSWKVDPVGDAKTRGDALKALADGIAAAEGVAPEGFVVDREALFVEAGVPLLAAPKKPLPPANDTTPPEPIQQAA